MSLDTHFSADQDTPQPSSIDFEPPAYSQPTLPPPAVEANAARSWSSQWGTRIVGAGIAALAVATASAYSLLPHAAPAAAAAPVPTEFTVQLDQAVAAFPRQAAETSCTASATAGSLPLVLHSAVGALSGGIAPSAIETELLFGSVPVTATSIKVASQRYVVMRTVDVHEPVAGLGEPVTGRYEGVLVVYDAASNAPLCQTVVRTWSSASLLQHGVSSRVLHDDFVSRVRAAVSEGATRLQIQLDI